MSVINRMLSDLERRGAPSQRSTDGPLGAADAPRRKRSLPPRFWLALLALLLLVIAILLWGQRGEHVLTALGLLEPPASASAAAPPEPAPEIVGMAFESDAEGARLVLSFSRSLERDPRYSRSGREVSLLLDVAADELLVPAPPEGQAVFRGISLAPGANGRTRIRLQVAREADLRVEAGDRSFALAGTVPEPLVPPEVAAAAEGVDANGGATPGEPEPGTTAATGTPEPATTSSGATVASESAADSTGSPEADPVTTGAGDDETGGATDADGQTIAKPRSADVEIRARRRYREAQEAWSSGNIAQARSLLRETLALKPGLHAARDLLASLLRRAGDVEGARSVLAEGASLAPARLAFAMPYARLLVDAGELERAADVLGAARANGVGTAGYHALTAAIAQRRGRHRFAAGEYTRALESRPGAGLWWLGLAVSLAAIDKPAEAGAAFREARATGTLSESLDGWAQRRINELKAQGEG